MIYRQLLAFFLSFALIFSSTSSLAATSVGGWTVTDALIAGATTTIEALKGKGSSALKSAISVAPSAAKLAKHLIKGGGAAALLIAVPQLIGEGVDWVLDPENNAIKYKDKSGAGAGAGAGAEYVYYINHAGVTNACYPASACIPILKSINPSQNYTHCVEYPYPNLYADCYYPWGDGVNRDIIYRQKNPAYDPNAPASPDEYKRIPIATVAQKVIANAEAGEPSSQEAVKAVALEGFAAGEYDAALDAAAIPDTGVENPPDTENPPKDPAAPSEPFDASPIIEAINALKALLAGILSSVTSLADWFKGEPEGKPEDNELDIPDPALPNVDSTVSFGGSCPADLGADFNLYGTNFNFVLMPFSKLCPLLSTFVKPTLILLGSFMAVAIVGGRKDA